MSMEPMPTESSIESLFEEPYMEVATFANPEPKVISGPGHGGITDPDGGDDGNGDGDD